ncbi:PAS domain S-box protein [Marinivivus vitaminiproducens]|uniref:hybrid sensor histidine kinase/response regulator n=1 Tax=Marinivivus vitaminiproducens TaxID=3035935 RepID=UPI0027AAE4AA|nr:PAS domain S-box protein [Geminicoccaceae bacterium SCSIO 64248]
MAHDQESIHDLPSDDRYRLLIEAVVDYAIYMLDPDGIVVSWNPGAQRFKGYEAAEIVGQHFSRFYIEEDRRAGLPATALATAAREGRYENEGWRVRKDGTPFWAHVVIDPIRGPSGSLLGYAKVTRDVSDRRNTQAALKASEDRFRVFVQGVADYAIYMLDRGGRITDWNLGARRIYGFTPGEIVGAPFARLFVEEDRLIGEPQRALEYAARHGRFEGEGWRIRKVGERFWAQVRIDAILGEDKTLLGFAKVTRDVTERNEAQQKLEQTRAALFQSQKMEAIGQLAGGIAHDFNNLLTVITSSLEVVRDRLAEDRRTVRLVDNALQGAQRAAALTQRMLTFARRQDFEPEPVDLSGLVHALADLLRSSMGSSVALSLDFPHDLPWIRTDANQLETALLNLAVNARDAMPEGGSVTISARQASANDGPKPDLAEGRYVCLAVTDSGEGMDDATLAQAIDPFFTTKGVSHGTGLGLPMVHGIAEQSGGRLVLKSRKGHGTTAELWLPVAHANSEDVPAATQAMPSLAEDDPVRLVIALVEDDALILMNATDMLEELGHVVLPAPSGADALEILKGGRKVDLVITDQAMPHMTGERLTAAIRAEWPTMPIVLVTCYGEVVHNVEPNVTRLDKPFDTAALQVAIERAVRLQSSI